jgi:hypothetical protein
LQAPQQAGIPTPTCIGSTIQPPWRVKTQLTLTSLSAASVRSRRYGG